MSLPAPAPVACPHCAAPVEGPVGTYCCHGCETAALILREAGLGGWYAAREQAAPRASWVDEAAWAAVPVQVDADGVCTADLSIDGLRCASCVWVTEKLLERTEGVVSAHVSYATGRAQVRWDPERTQLARLAGRVAAIGYTPRPAGDVDRLDRDLMVRLGVAAFGAMNVMGLSVALYVGWADGMADRWAQLFRWATLAVATPVVTYAARPFFQGAIRGLKVGVLHMDAPIALAIALLYGHGIVATVLHEDGYLDSVTMLVALLLAGRVLEARGRKRAADAALSLAASVPRTARRAVGDAVEVVPSEQLAVGDRIDLGAGDEVAADGVVLAGKAFVRMAVLTGESRPTEVGPGDAVVAGAVVEDGSLRVGVTRAGQETLVARMAQDLVSASAAPRDPSATDKLAPWFTIATLVAAALTAGVTAWLYGPDAAVSRTVAVLVVACPCALALAAPMVGASGLGALARRGLLLRGVDTLDALAGINTVVLDKTGTLTWGRPRVTAASDEALRVAAGLERFSRHPVAAAILDEAVARGLPVPVATDVVETAGVGVQGHLEGRLWRIRRGGADRVVLTADDGLSHTLTLVDTPRPGVAADVASLRAAGIRVVMLTGDHGAVASRVAEALGVDEVLAEVDPQGKATLIQGLRAQGRRVVFVGDGLNDGPAMVAANVGVAMSSGAASTLLAADGVLASERLTPLVGALSVAPLLSRRVQRSLNRSLVYNVVAVSVAMAGWINPLVAAILMPLSSGLVIATALGTESAALRTWKV